MTEKEKGATLSNTPNTIKNNTSAKLQNIPDVGKDMNVILDFFRYVEETRLGASVRTGILLGSVCRYVDYLLKIGAVQVTKIAPDKRTKHDAQYLSADSSKWQKPKFVQLSLFDKEG